MKFQIVIFASLVALAASAATRFNPRFRYQRVEEAPYAAAGYRPAGEEFRLPARQQAPPALYGPPEDNVLATTENEASATTTESPTTTTFTPARSQLKKLKQSKPEKIQEEEVFDQGVYYIYHPSGFLQRVMYEARNDVRNMGYTAQLTYRDVEPIREPVYTYDPETLVFQQIKL